MLPAVLFVSSAFALATSALARPSSYAVWAADSAIARKQGNGLSGSSPEVSYEHGEFQWALRLLYEKTGNVSYYNYIKAGVDEVVSSSGTVGGGYVLSDYSLDPIRVGPSFLYLYSMTNGTQYKTAADLYHSQLNGHPRTAQGQFWHKKRYTNQGWLDGIYMGDVFYTQYVKAFQPTNTTAWSDIEKQFSLMYTNTLQETGATNYTGLLYHGYDYSKTASWASSDRGHSPEIWDRAVGWYMMALVDVIETLPTTPSAAASARSTLLAQLQTLAPRVVKAADPTSGVWWLVITQPARSGNYFESSGAAMFVYAVLKAVRLGYVSDSDGSIVAGAKKAYDYIVKNFVVDNGDGTMNWLKTVSVGSLSTTGDYAYYIAQSITTNDLKGLAAFVLASLEYERL